MIARYSLSTSAAAAITLALLLLMSHLIVTGRPVIGTDRAVRWQPFVVEPRPPLPVEPRPGKPDRQPPADPPKTPVVEPGGTGGGGPTVRGPARPVFEPAALPRHGGPGDGELLPVVKVQPAYPAAAAMSNLEGYVIVEFSVGRAGNVEDVVVVESSARVFEQASIEAVRRFRYRPRIVGGEPVRVTGIRQLLTFELENGSRR